MSAHNLVLLCVFLREEVKSTDEKILAPTEFKIWNTKGLRHRVSETLGLEQQSLLQIHIEQRVPMLQALHSFKNQLLKLLF